MKKRYISFALLCVAGFSFAMHAMEREKVSPVNGAEQSTSSNAYATAQPSISAAQTTISSEPPTIANICQLTTLAKTAQDTDTLGTVLRLLLTATAKMELADSKDVIRQIAGLMPEIQKKAPNFALSLLGEKLKNAAETLREEVSKRHYIPNRKTLLDWTHPNIDLAYGGFIHAEHLILFGHSSRDVNPKRVLVIVNLRTREIKKELEGLRAAPFGNDSIVYVTPGRDLFCYDLTDEKSWMLGSDRYNFVADFGGEKQFAAADDRFCSVLSKGDGSMLRRFTSLNSEDILGLQATDDAICIWQKKRKIQMWTLSKVPDGTGKASAVWQERDFLDTPKLSAEIAACAIVKLVCDDPWLIVGTTDGRVYIVRSGASSFLLTTLPTPATCFAKIKDMTVAIGQELAEDQENSYVHLVNQDGRVMKTLAFDKKKGSPVKLTFANGILQIIFSSGTIEECYLNEFATFADMCKQLTA